MLNVISRDARSPIQWKKKDVGKNIRFKNIRLNNFLQYRFYPHIEFYGRKTKPKNNYLTDIKARGVSRRWAFISYKIIVKLYYIKFW